MLLGLELSFLIKSFTKSEDNRIMKKMLLGLTLIIFSIVLFLFDEIAHFALFQNSVVSVIYMILPFVGLVISIWGLVEKDKDNK